MSDENGDAHVSCANVSPNVFQDLHHTRRNPERLSKQRFFWVEPFLPQTDPRWWPGLEGAGVYPASVACQGTLIGLILWLCPRASFCLTLAFGFLLSCRRKKKSWKCHLFCFVWLGIPSSSTRHWWGNEREYSSGDCEPQVRAGGGGWRRGQCALARPGDQPPVRFLGGNESTFGPTHS